MSTDTEFRFPTFQSPGASDRFPGPPVYPQPSIYETIEIEREPGKGVFFDHVTIEQIMARPKWDFEETNLRLFKEKKAREAAALKKAEAAKARRDRTKKSPTPKRQP